MWVRLKEGNIWVNLDHAWRIEHRPDDMARIFFTNKEIVVTSPKVNYLGKDYAISILMSTATSTIKGRKDRFFDDKGGDGE